MNQIDDAPRIIYVNPTGSNPTGVTYTLERRKEIYKIAQEYNLLILEDDAYFYLQFREFQDREPSFLSLDVDGRVLRMDSFSKIIAPGLRLGLVSGPRQIVDKLHWHVQVSTQQPSSMSQMIVYKLLKQWGKEGFQAHIKRVCAYYINQRDQMVKSCNKWLKGLAEWTVPEGGMFMWIKILGIPNTNEFIMNIAPQKGVVVVPGFCCYPETSEECQQTTYVRVAYTYITTEAIDKALQLLAIAIREERKINEPTRKA